MRIATFPDVLHTQAAGIPLEPLTGTTHPQKRPPHWHKISCQATTTTHSQQITNYTQQWENNALWTSLLVKWRIISRWLMRWICWCPGDLGQTNASTATPPTANWMACSCNVPTAKWHITAHRPAMKLFIWSIRSTALLQNGNNRGASKDQNIEH